LSPPMTSIFTLSPPSRNTIGSFAFLMCVLI
jgi:hypothetical protein